MHLIQFNSCNFFFKLCLMTFAMHQYSFFISDDNNILIRTKNKPLYVAHQLLEFVCIKKKRRKEETGIKIGEYIAYSEISIMKL